MGCGVIGLDMIQTLRAWGVTEIIAVAKHPFQGEVARSLGAKEIVLMQQDIDPVNRSDPVDGRLGGGPGV